MDVSLDDDGVPSSLVQFYVPASAIEGIAPYYLPLEPGGDVRSFNECRLDSLPGALGTEGPVTLFYGTAIMKASI